MRTWNLGVTDMDVALMAEFSIPIILHLPMGDVETKGVFDDPFSLSQVGSGGRISDSAPELSLRDEDALGIEARQLVTISGKQWLVVTPPEPDGTGITKLILGNYSGEQSKPVIRY
ncbi:head-tail joining protein [Vibrio algicola]|uniref:Uncharacterized protein n=1 Tax=Vibrio algicola TaxID=2662262 RepID=A0A5Q0TIA0_9VIBR|nr:head-tail joining protein [Vibrio algicola]